MNLRFQATVTAARRHGDLYFAGLLPQDRILKAFGPARALWQGWLYTPAATVWIFLSQCLSVDHSCRDAVACFLTWRLAQGQRACSAETGAYCTARGHLPEKACRKLVRQTGKDLEDEAPSEWHWEGRRVRVVDGSTITMADTQENQDAYPQQASQQPGCGFPIARILVVFSLTVGTVLEAAIGRYQGKQTGENSLFRRLHRLLEPRDVVLGDRYFSGWFDLALLHKQAVDVVVRKHQLRATDFRTGTSLGKADQLVSWPKPPRPEWMSPEEYATMPERLDLRESCGIPVVAGLCLQRGQRPFHHPGVRLVLDRVEHVLIHHKRHPIGAIRQILNRRREVGIVGRDVDGNGRSGEQGQTRLGAVGQRIAVQRQIRQDGHVANRRHHADVVVTNVQRG